MKRVAIYARVSTDGQEAENQLGHLRRFAETQSWTIYHEYVDHDTGAHTRRSEFLRMFTDAAKRRFDVILFWALDRFSREGVLETLQHLSVLGSYDVGFRSFTEPFLDSCGVFRDAIIGILAVLAKQERIRISERVRAGLDRARKEGTRTGRPIGRPRVVFHRDQIAELRSQGISWRQIARKLGAGVGTVRRIYRDIEFT